MVEAAQVRALASALPEVHDASDGDRLVFEVAGKGFAWTWMERLDPKKPRRPCPAVLAVRCALERKEMLIEAAPEIYFDEPHYRGFPAVLVRLAAIGEDELAALLEGAWRLKAPKALLKATAR
ncbi:MAG TPA: MmcQ/YjbR family DNA-binding protein [Caulobacteraceae bacterium]|jgi:hypothetical protein